MYRITVETKEITRIDSGIRFANGIVFGPGGSKKLFVTKTEFGTMEVFDVGTDGYPLYDGS